MKKIAHQPTATTPPAAPVDTNRLAESSRSAHARIASETGLPASSGGPPRRSAYAASTRDMRPRLGLPHHDDSPRALGDRPLQPQSERYPAHWHSFALSQAELGESQRSITDSVFERILASAIEVEVGRSSRRISHRSGEMASSRFSAARSEAGDSERSGLHGVAREEAAAGGQTEPAGGERYDAQHVRAHDAVTSYLDSLIPSPNEPGAPSQAALEAEYALWAAQELVARQKAYGPNGGYRFRQSMQPAGLDALIPAAYESFKAFLSSATRSPFGGATSSAIDEADGELTAKLRPALIGGMVAGVGAGITESLLLPAMDRRARLANMPAFKSVDSKVLVPEPSRVQMEVTPGGVKRFWRTVRDSEVGREGSLDDADRPTDNAVKGLAHDARKRLEARQKLMDGKAEATLLKPAVTAALNTARRAASSAGGILAPGYILGTSMVASGSAAALTKFALDSSKATALAGQAVVDDLVGGQQRVNLFRLARPREDVEPPRWSDARRLPGLTLEVAQEAAAMAKQAVASPAQVIRTGRDLLSRHITGNVVAFWASYASGTLLASEIRGGYGVPHDSGSQQADAGALRTPAAAPSPAASESYRSSGSLLQQAGQSFVNDLTWNALKSTLGDTSEDLAAALDRNRDRKQSELWRQAKADFRSLRGPIDRLDQALATDANPLAAELRLALHVLTDGREGVVIERGRLAGATATIGRLASHPSSSAYSEELRAVGSGLAAVSKSLAQRQVIVDWRTGQA